MGERQEEWIEEIEDQQSDMQPEHRTENNLSHSSMSDFKSFANNIPSNLDGKFGQPSQMTPQRANTNKSSASKADHFFTALSLSDISGK